MSSWSKVDPANPKGSTNPRGQLKADGQGGGTLGPGSFPAGFGLVDDESADAAKDDDADKDDQRNRDPKTLAFSPPLIQQIRDLIRVWSLGFPGLLRPLGFVEPFGFAGSFRPLEGSLIVLPGPWRPVQITHDETIPPPQRLVRGGSPLGPLPSRCPPWDVDKPILPFIADRYHGDGNPPAMERQRRA